MKRVVSVSIGSSERDHVAEVELMGERVRVERIGTDGDIDKAIALIRELDGQVDAFGMGGIDLYVWAGGRRYVLRDARRIAAAAQNTPIVDGSGLKNSLERRIIPFLEKELGLRWPEKRVLLVSAIDRFGMAEALAQSGCQLVIGDLMFVLGIPIPLRSLSTFTAIARLLAPLAVQLPISVLYPTGSKQTKVEPKFTRWYQWADVIAGDFHFIRRNMPDDLRGKTVITQTITKADVAELKRRGVRLLVTATPELNGRSFATNVIEALLIAVSGQRRELSASEYLGLIDRLELKPRIEYLTDPVPDTVPASR
ncbi:MAG: quinate 5-dehydrogenase [Firmicutes bacterium ZCTH02-B6]|nr:MAG: quinate 5-dehydrogenase [Firmicutes bacterium ZCTH02-B6]